jgi:hypothetical protein
MTYQKKKLDAESIPEIRRRREKEGRIFGERVLRSANATAGFKQSSSKQEYLNYLLHHYGVPGWNPACSIPTRQLMLQNLAASVLNMHENDWCANGVDLYHLTVAFPEDRTGDRQVYIEWTKIKRRVATMMSGVCEDFIGVGEIDITINEKCVADGKSEGRDLCPHVHVLFWTSNKLSPAILGNQLSSRFPPNADGMKVVKINRCGRAAEDVARVASYLFKAPQGGKTKRMDKKHGSDGSPISAKATKYNSKKAQRPIISSRIAEVLSHTEIRTLMISGGEGLPLKNQLLKVLSETTKLLGTNPPEDFGYERTLSFWRAMRAHGWGKNYPAPQIKK